MLTFELVTLNGVKFGEEVYEVMLPTPDGIIAVFPHHMPLISLAVPGVVSIRRLQADSDDLLEHFATNGGIIEISERRVRLLADEADHSSEVSEQMAAEALKRAQQAAREARDQVSLDKANQLIQAHQAKLKVASIKRRRRSV